jgi:hypothetical protein
MIDFNEVRPHDALGGKTPAEVYRDSERRSLARSSRATLQSGRPGGSPGMGTSR